MALPTYNEALERALSIVHPLGAHETVPLGECDGRVLAEALEADRDLPPFNRAQMDGYALRAAEVGRVESWPVAATIPAGASADVRVPEGQCVAIATGAALPDDVDTVIPHEQSDRANPVRFGIDAVERGSAVHARGADAAAGATLLRAGAILGPHHLGVAAAIGARDLVVARRPRVAVLTSGDEVMPVGAAVEPHQIRNSNGPQTESLLRRMGAEALPFRHVRDTPEETSTALDGALELADVVITIGGISAGERDCFPAALETLGVTFAVRGAAIQPGKPVLVGHTERGERPRVVVGLPGNPVSSLVCACLFVWPIVRKLMQAAPALPWREVLLAEAVKPNPRRHAFRPACWANERGVEVPRWAGSGDLAHTAATHGIVALPKQDRPVEQGAAVPFLAWPGACCAQGAHV